MLGPRIGWLTMIVGLIALQALGCGDAGGAPASGSARDGDANTGAGGGTQGGMDQGTTTAQGGAQDGGSGSGETGPGGNESSGGEMGSEGAAGSMGNFGGGQAEGSAPGECRIQDDCPPGTACRAPDYAGPVCRGITCPGDMAGVCDDARCAPDLCGFTFEEVCGGLLPACQPACTSDAECTGTLVCSSSGRCLPPAHCGLGNVACPIHFRCVGEVGGGVNGCERLTCAQDGDCADPGYCFEGVCYTTPGYCMQPPLPCLAP